MANHIRKQLRDAIKTRLTGLVTTGANVTTDRDYVFADAELPALKITVEGEQIGGRSVSLAYPPHATGEQHLIQVEIRAVSKKVAAIDDELDQISKEVGVAIWTDPTLGGLADDVRIVSTFFERDATLETPQGINVMQYEFDTWVRSDDHSVRV
jgi:hypothetical protein